MSEPNLTSVQPAGNRWGTRLADGRRLTLEVVGLEGRLLLAVATDHAPTVFQAYLDATEARALGAAARMLSGAEHEDYERVRRDERERLAQLFEENRDTLSTFPRSTAALLDLVVLLLRLNNPKET